MPATLLRGCLQSLGATGTEEIEYIETAYSHDDYLNNVCNAVYVDLSYDKTRTESLPHSCTISHSTYMYPSHCNQGWLGNDCSNGCGNTNYNGFYCKGIHNTITKNKINQIKLNTKNLNTYCIQLKYTYDLQYSNRNNNNNNYYYH